MIYFLLLSTILPCIFAYNNYIATCSSSYNLQHILSAQKNILSSKRLRIYPFHPASLVLASTSDSESEIEESSATTITTSTNNPSRQYFSKVQEIKKPIVDIITKNPITIVLRSAYSFFYWLPRRNLQYDSPWVLFRNTSAEWIAW